MNRPLTGNLHDRHGAINNPTKMDRGVVKRKRNERTTTDGEAFGYFSVE